MASQLIKQSQGGVRFFAIVLLLLLFSLSPAAWSAPGDELLEGAKKEGKLSIYYASNVAGYRNITGVFKEKYPFITVESFQALENKLLMRVLAEDRAKKYIPDIIDTRGFAINILKEKGLLMQYNSPNFKFLPPEFVDPEGYYFANCFAIQVVAYNTKLVSPNDVPKGFDDLLHPKWKGKLFMDERDYEWYGNMIEIMGKEKALDFMRKLSKQNIRFRAGRLLLATLLAAGEVPMFLTASGHTIEQFREKGAPIKWTTFDPIIGEVGVMGITSHAANPNTAKLFTNFMSSKEGQDVIAASFGKNPTRPDAKKRYPSLETKGHKLFFSSVTIDQTKFEKEFRAMFMLR